MATKQRSQIEPPGFEHRENFAPFEFVGLIHAYEGGKSKDFQSHQDNLKRLGWKVERIEEATHA